MPEPGLGRLQDQGNQLQLWENTVITIMITWEYYDYD